MGAWCSLNNRNELYDIGMDLEINSLHDASIRQFIDLGCKRIKNPFDLIFVCDSWTIDNVLPSNHLFLYVGVF